MSESQDPIRRGEDGVVRIGKDGVPLDAVLSAYKRGHSAAAVREQFPSLSDADIESALAYLRNDPDEFDPNAQVRDADWRDWRTKSAW